MTALPGLSLPGLVASTPTVRAPTFAAPPSLAPPRTEQLPPRSELRFEVAFDKIYKIRVTRGIAEIFGTELAPNVVYTFTGAKAAVFTWEGCALELQGQAESEYIGSETEAMVEWLNVHGMLDTLRQESGSNGGPRVLILGADSAGKSSLIKCLAAWALKVGRNPTILNLDPRDGGLTVPSALTATTYASQMDVESAGWGQSAVSGPTAVPGRTPLTYHFPYSTPYDHPALFKALTTRLALAVTSKLEQDPQLKASGFIIDTPPSFNRPQDGYDIANHIVSEFSINVILTMGSERLYNDILRRFPPSSNPDAPAVLRIANAPGAVSRDEAFLKAHRAASIRSYFFGDPRTSVALNPHSQTLPFNEVTVYRAIDPNAGTMNADFLPGQDDDDDDYNPAGASDSLFNKIEPAQNLLNAVAAIKHAPPGSSGEAIRDAAVMGFVYVAEVDEGKKRIRFLAPHPGRWGDKVLVVGNWPAGVGDLVS